MTGGMQSMRAAGGDGREGFSPEELQLAARNSGMPLEGLRRAVTPVGMHYLLIHYDIPFADPASWRLVVDGAVDRPLSLSMDDLRARPARTEPVTLECAGNGRAGMAPRAVSQPWLLEAVGTGEWTGTPLRLLLDEAGVASAAVDVVFTGADRGVEGGVEQSYQRSLPVDDATSDEILVAYDLNGAALPPQHGAPVRLLVPGWYGMASVKWLTTITVSRHAFDGYQQVRSYRYRSVDGEAGAPVTRIEPRSLMVPPGVPDFLTRRRFVVAGTCRLQGRAWSGWGPITAVEVSDDGGTSWQPAQLEPPPGRHAWQRWTAAWTPPAAGRYQLCSRATDRTGRTQPLDPPWNLGGYGNNAVQRVDVTVGAAGGS